MIDEKTEEVGMQKEKIVQLISECLKTMKYEKTIKKIEKQIARNVDLEIESENAEDGIAMEENQLPSLKASEDQVFSKQENEANQKNQTIAFEQKKINPQKHLQELFTKKDSFDSLLNKCQTIFSSSSQTKMEEIQETPRLIQILNCSWNRLTKYKLPIHKTMKIECENRIVFLKMCEVDYYCCVIDEENNIKVIDVEKREIHVQKKEKKKEENEENARKITSVEWIDWQSLMVGDNKGTLKIYNSLNMNLEEEYKNLHDSSIISVAFFNDYRYSCSFDRVLKKMNKNEKKSYICSGYCKMIKLAQIPNYIIGVDQDQKNIYMFDEITEKQTLLFSLNREKKRIGAVQVSSKGNLFVGIERGYPEIYEIQPVSRKTYKRVKVSTKSSKISMTQFFKGRVLAISTTNNESIQYYSTKNWNMIYEHSPQEKKKGNQKYSQVGNAQKQRIIYVNGKWIQMLDIQQLELVERRIKKQSMAFFNQHSLRDSGFLSLLQNFQLNYQNIF